MGAVVLSSKQLFYFLALAKDYWQGMDSKYIFPKSSLAEQFSDIYDSGRISNHDLRRWKLLGVNQALSDEDAKIVNRLFHAVKRGWLQVVEA